MADSSAVKFREWLLKLKEQRQQLGIPEKQLPLTWRNLSVLGEDSRYIEVDTVGSILNPLNGIKKARGQKNTRHLLKNFNGQVMPGEMMLVVGRPGSGCTSFLKTLANKRTGYSKVEGDVRYASLDHNQAANYRQQILYNSEEDIHVPTLTVGQTKSFALRNKTPKTRPDGQNSSDFVEEHQTEILNALGIGHTTGTLVGNEYIRGVSGGERKRVSLSEVLAGQSPVQLWDNSTRGLDASTALDLIRVWRAMADIDQRTIIATLYQTGNLLYDLFDKVLVIAEGRTIYYGSRASAKAYFESLGFECPDGANTADFLTSVTVATERRIRSGFHTFPRTIDDFVTAYENSDVYCKMMEEIQDPGTMTGMTETFKQSVMKEKFHPRGNPSPYTATLVEQIKACTIRGFQIQRGDVLSMIAKVASAIIQSLVVGSLFYNLSLGSDSTFVRPGALFFPIVFFAIQAMSEVAASFMGRPILMRHKDFGLYRPTAYTISSVIVDIPITILQVSIFDIIYYFMCGFQMDARRFFFHWFILITMSLTMNSMFRACGALCGKFGNAAKASGFLMMVMMLYAGYMVPYYEMKVWFRWLFYLNPVAYGFESLMLNEYDNLMISCDPPQLIPFGPSYTDPTHQSCTVPGSLGNGFIDGNAYIYQQYNYSQGHKWRGFGVICAFWAFTMFLTTLGFEQLKLGSQSSSLVFKRGAGEKRSLVLDVEKSQSEATIGLNYVQSTAEGDEKEKEIDGKDGEMTGKAVFSWRNLNYTVNYQGGKKQLLHDVTGYVKPGQLMALMGSSGAGKTTLLDVLAQRKDEGYITGEIMVDGRPLGVSFQRSAGYCEQLDIHEPTSTVREALEFSAKLRQSSTATEAEKLAYVDTIVDLLEMSDISDAIIGSPGAGLTVEQRKRLTIGVELVAKPSIVFLDEPTSGLDGQSAYNIVRFMRRLANTGQAVLCTIHQPSASLFEEFDTLLLLAKGGYTSYFGPTGKKSCIVLEYFARHGAPCEKDVNPAEHIVDTVQGRNTENTNWADIWLASPECTQRLQEVDALKEDCLSRPPSTNDDGCDFSTPTMKQIEIVLKRHNISLWRNPDYIMNKMMLHIINALFGGFTFWKIGNSAFDLQLTVFSVFNFLFVAPGVINQMQPLFLHNRDIFEAREKKSKTYKWIAFVCAQAIAEVPWLIICAVLYFACWYFTTGLPVKASISGQVFFQMILYEFLYTAIGQSIAAYSPNEFFAHLINPIVLGCALITFCGVLVPYANMPNFWKYWLYWLDPFHYLMGGLLTQPLYNKTVTCKPHELARFPPPSNTTCGEYLEEFLGSAFGYIVDEEDREMCGYCAFSSGGEYARTFNLNDNGTGWRDTGITALFVVSSYLCVLMMMKFRSKKTKSAKAD